MDFNDEETETLFSGLQGRDTAKSLRVLNKPESACFAVTERKNQTVITKRELMLASAPIELMEPEDQDDDQEDFFESAGLG